MTSALLLFLLQPPIAIAGGVQLWGDWVAACDNAGNCFATSLPQKDNQRAEEDGDVLLDITLSQSSSPGATTVLSLFASPAANPESKSSDWTFAIDGKAIAVHPEWRRGVLTLDDRAARKLLFEMRRGRILQLRQNGSLVHDLHIDPVRSILAYFQSKHVPLSERVEDTGNERTFLKQLSASKEDQAVLTISGASRFPAGTLTSSQLKFWSGVDRCAVPRDAGTTPLPHAEFHALDDAATLVLIDSACPGYNPLSYSFIKYRTGLVRPALFGPHPFADPFDQVVHLPGARWSGARRRLIARSKGRAAGDCGEYAEYAWDGKSFHLTDYRTMPVCRGSFNLVPVYTRQVRELPPGPHITEVLQN